MSTGIQAIQTRYKGYHFRSRLEARWAVFFDALGYKWEYEPEGFKLPSGKQYLPDFKTTSLTGLVHWYEVKASGVAVSLKVLECQEAGMDVLLLCGDPLEHLCFDDVDPLAEGCICPRCGCLGVDSISTGLGVWSFSCLPCDRDTPCGGGHPSEDGLFGRVTPHKGWIDIEQPYLGTYLRRVHAAASAARSARFEHGQSGANL